MYLDTAILVKLVVREEDSLFYAQLAQDQMVWTAEIAISECYSALLRKEREAAITARQRKAAWKHLELDAAEHRLALVSVTRSLLERTNAILEACHPEVALRSLDAIHIAAAEQCASWPLCTNDSRMRAAAIKMGFPLTPLPAHKGSHPR